MKEAYKFKYLGCMANGKGTDVINCKKKVMNGKNGAIRVPVNAESLNRSCAREIHENMLISALMYESKIIVWKTKVEVQSSINR